MKDFFVDIFLLLQNIKLLNYSAPENQSLFYVFYTKYLGDTITHEMKKFDGRVHQMLMDLNQEKMEIIAFYIVWYVYGFGEEIRKLLNEINELVIKKS